MATSDYLIVTRWRIKHKKVTLRKCSSYCEESSSKSLRLKKLAPKWKSFSFKCSEIKESPLSISSDDGWKFERGRTRLMACPSYELCTTFACKTFCMVYDHVSSSRVWLEIMNGKQLYMLLHYISLNNEHFKAFCRGNTVWFDVVRRICINFVNIEF